MSIPHTALLSMLLMPAPRSPTHFGPCAGLPFFGLLTTGAPGLNGSEAAAALVRGFPRLRGADRRGAARSSGAARLAGL